MADELSAIDTTHIDGLVTIKVEQDELTGLIEKARSRQEKVPELVFKRVVGDYEARIRALEVEARPLREKARAEFARLVALHRAATAALAKAQLDAQEIEFRHEVGEFNDEEFGRRYKVANEAVAACQTSFDQADQLRVRFLEVIPDEPEPEPAPVPAQEATVGSSAGSPNAVAEEPAGAPGGTILERAIALATEAGPAASGAAPAGEAGFGDSGAFGTVAIAPAVLVEEGSGNSHKLGAMTSIGRTPNNQIVIPVREVSRNHAQVVLAENGYLLKDLGSGNGTFVNGQRIADHLLAEGDRIQVGDRILVFKSR